MKLVVAVLAVLVALLTWRVFVQPQPPAATSRPQADVQIGGVYPRPMPTIDVHRSDSPDYRLSCLERPNKYLCP